MLLSSRIQLSSLNSLPVIPSSITFLWYLFFKMPRYCIFNLPCLVMQLIVISRNMYFKTDYGILKHKNLKLGFKK